MRESSDIQLHMKRSTCNYSILISWRFSEFACSMLTVQDRGVFQFKDVWPRAQTNYVIRINNEFRQVDNDFLHVQKQTSSLQPRGLCFTTVEVLTYFIGNFSPRLSRHLLTYHVMVKRSGIRWTYLQKGCGWSLTLTVAMIRIFQVICNNFLCNKVPRTLQGLEHKTTPSDTDVCCHVLHYRPCHQDVRGSGRAVPHILNLWRLDVSLMYIRQETSWAPRVVLHAVVERKKKNVCSCPDSKSSRSV